MSNSPHHHRPLALLILVFLLANLTHAVQLSKLVRNKRKYISPLTLNVLPTKTAIISASSGSSYLDLRLDPIVNIPKDSLTFSTLLLVHLHPKNETVIWANAVTTIDTFNLGVAVDSKSNTYAAGESQRGRDITITPSNGTIDIIKYNRAGKLVWQTTYSPPLRKDGKPRYRLEDLDGGVTETALNVIDSSLVVITAKRKFDFKDVPAYFVFSAKTGKFLRIVDAKLPPKTVDIDPTSVVMTNAKEGPIACYAFVGTRSVFGGPPRLFVTCASLDGSGVVRSELLDSLESENDGFFHLNTADLDRGRRARGDPSIFFASERVTFPAQGKVVNELFIRRVSSKTLQEVNWATGKSKGSVRPILISLPGPHPMFGNTHTSFQLSLAFGEKSRTAVSLFWTSINLKKFEPETKKTGRIIVSGVPRKESEPTQYWLFFLDKKRRLFPHLIDLDIGKGSLFTPEKVAFSHDERFVYVLGVMRSRLVVRAIKNPVFGRRKQLL